MAEKLMNGEVATMMNKIKMTFNIKLHEAISHVRNRMEKKDLSKRLQLGRPI